MKRYRLASKRSILMYLVVFGFLFPRGFISESPLYHKVCSAFMWLSVFLTWMQWIKHSAKEKGVLDGKFKRWVLSTGGYFILSIIITILCRRNLSSGLQQLFAAPSVCVFMLLNLKLNPQKLLNAIANVMCVEFTVNAIMAASQPYINGIYHVIFLGHIQVVSQYGILAILVGVLFELLYHDNHKRNVYLLIVTFYTMLTTDAESATFTLVGLLIAFIIYKWKLSKLLTKKSELYVFFMIALSVLIIYCSAINPNLIPSFDIHGRRFVWQSALEKIKERPIAGYGIDGVLLSTFWSSGFNYAHNQLVQNLLDGGIILTISFWNMIIGFAKEINKIRMVKYRVLCNASLIALLFVMLFDSTTLYIYMYMILSIIFSTRNLIFYRR